MGLTKAQLEALNITSFPDNTTGLITPTILRGYNTASIENTVNQDVYTTDSASFKTSITNLNTFSASALVSISNLNASSASQQVSITNLNTTTASLLIETSNLETFSASALISISNLNQSSASQQISINALNAATASYVTSAITASSLVTASFSGNTLTFTKGDASTFGVVIPDVSGSTINTGSFATTGSNAFIGNQTIAGGLIVSSSSQPFAFSGSSFVVDTFDGGGAITFRPGTAINFFGNTNFTSPIRTTVINVDNFAAGGFYGFNAETDGRIYQDFSGSVNSRINAIVTGTGFATTGSNTFTGNQNIQGTLTASLADGFTYVGNSSNISTLVATSSFGSTINTGSFATTGSNTFVGNQTITSTGNTQLNIETTGGPGSQQTNLDFKGNNSNFRAYGDFRINNNGDAGGSGSIKFTNSNNFIEFAADQGIKIGATNGVGNGIDAGNISMQVRSGSLSLAAAGFSNTTASLTHLSSSSNTNNINLVFKPNSNTGDTIISGSGNIFTNPATPTTGYTRYIGGSNNLYLNNSNGINSQVTASAASVSGARPTMNNNIFQGTSNFSINQATNGGTHTYSGNILGGANAVVTINALAYTGSAFAVSDNIFKGGAITINPASASLAEIAAGVSGSAGNGLDVIRNIVTGTGAMTINIGPKVNSGFPSYFGNIVNSGTLTMNNISSSATVTATANNVTQNQSYTNLGAAGLALHGNAGSMTNNYGAMNLFASASAINATFTIGTAAVAVTNRMYSGSLGSGSLTYANNLNAGTSHTYTASGSFGGTGQMGMTGNAIIGNTNTVFTNVEGRGMYVDFRSNVVGGQNLILTGSNNFAITGSGGGYFGRFNADDGIRNGTGENIFFVGTGTSATTRKTGFLIDSGSNSYFEGSLNVSGSTSLTGSLTIQSGSSFFANGNKQFNVGAFSSLVTQSGSANVSQSVTFNTTDISEGITLVSNSQITLANSGTYSITFSAQCDPITGAGDIYIWLKKNGTNVTNSATKLSLANNAAQLMTVNFVVNGAASDYFELCWQSDSGDVVLEAFAASGNIPAIPSVILTATQVR